ncbi:hypothetical protein [Streptomyces sp. CA-111067]|uniref:hypothetical protein n=1 Tax=Streptomyces sp. CA-111067 TaxID=3240046 RepID=UPI003D98B9B8
MAERDQGVTAGELLLAEYTAVKDEQRARIGFRDNLLYATIAAMAAAVAGALQVDHHGAELLLALPPVSVILGWTYLVNDEKISAIGRYLRDDLAPRLGALTAGPAGGESGAGADGAGADGSRVFGWESAHRGDPRRRTRKVLQLSVDLLTFCGAPVAAAAGYWSIGPVHPPLLLVSLAETAAVGVLAWQIVVYAEVRR